MIDLQWKQPDVAVVGAKGLLGSKLARRMASRAVALTSADLDIRDAKTVLATMERLGPAVVINAAAYTEVDACESNEQQATEVTQKTITDLEAATVKKITIARTKSKSPLLDLTTTVET